MSDTPSEPPSVFATVSNPEGVAWPQSVIDTIVALPGVISAVADGASINIEISGSADIRSIVPKVAKMLPGAPVQWGSKEAPK